MTTINISKLFKKETEHLKEFLKTEKNFTINFYYKNRELKPFNKNMAIVIDTLISSMIFRKKIRNKDYDLYNEECVLWKYYSLEKDNTIVIGKNCLFGSSENRYYNDVNKNLWINLLSKIDNPTNRFKFLFNHEVGHLIKEKEYIFGLNTLSVEDNFVLNKEISGILEMNPEINQLLDEVYADCFSIYMLSNGQEDIIKSLLGFIMKSRLSLCESTLNYKTYGYLDMIPMLLEFSKNLPLEYTLDGFNNALKESITYGLLKTLHRHHLEDNRFHLNWNNYLQQEDIDINKEKVKFFENHYHKIYNEQGYLKKMKHEILSNYDIDNAKTLGEKQLILSVKDIELETYINKEENNKIVFNNVEDIHQNHIYKEKITIKNIIGNLINKIYYFPKNGLTKDIKYLK